jgi:hypothetical protein
MPKIAAFLLIVLTLALTAAAQSPCTRYTAPGFSICVPEGWQLKPGSEAVYTAIFGPRSEVFVSNINFKFAVSSYPVETHVDGTLDYLFKHYKEYGITDIKLLSRARFDTDTKVPGVKLVFLTEFSGMTLNSVQYMMELKTGKLAVTGTGLNTQKASDDKIFDAAVKSIKIEP